MTRTLCSGVHSGFKSAQQEAELSLRKGGLRKSITLQGFSHNVHWSWTSGEYLHNEVTPGQGLVLALLTVQQDRYPKRLHDIRMASEIEPTFLVQENCNTQLLLWCALQLLT